MSRRSVVNLCVESSNDWRAQSARRRQLWCAWTGKRIAYYFIFGWRKVFTFLSRKFIDRNLELSHSSFLTRSGKALNLSSNEVNFAQISCHVFSFSLFLFFLSSVSLHRRRVPLRHHSIVSFLSHLDATVCCTHIYDSFCRSMKPATKVPFISVLFFPTFLIHFNGISKHKRNSFVWPEISVSFFLAEIDVSSSRLIWFDDFDDEVCHQWTDNWL